ncbi:MAG: pilus (MSHA type) biogenesis protein MshL [Gammaproteobacteria bacterium]|nr:pilus (MSHA type) biogenesis protein MshL [Gammaproteobacteria bacterium]
MKLIEQTREILIGSSLVLLLVSCGPTRPPEQSAGHISDDVVQEEAVIPAALTQTTLLPEPKQRPRLETYTVVVSDVPVKDLLFSMARDAKLNLDIHNDIEGTVTLNAIDQTLPQILDRLSKQTNIRYELDRDNLRVRADAPYLRTYKISYVNMARESSGVVSVATTLGSTGQGNIGEQGSSGGSQDENNSSRTQVTNTSNNKFWETLAKNIAAILNEDATAETEATDAGSDSKNVIVNKESGIIVVRATHKQHEIIQGFVDLVLGNAKRQVLIEATIAEINLSDRYQAGIDWNLIASDPTDGISFTSDFLGTNLGQAPFSTLSLAGDVGGDQLTATLSALEQFGDVQVLSSPKVIALNNQPAILKVVDNIVYFEMDVDSSVADSVSVTTFETEIKTVPVGFVMSVTPYIDEHDVVTLNIRPTISRIIDTVKDPNPAFANANVTSNVPVIQVREIESLLQVNSGDTAIIGGLMQDTVNDTSSGVPFLSDIPIIGALFRYEDDLREKSELVIFIRPVVVRHASLMGDLADYQKYLPKEPGKIQPDAEENEHGQQ